ncbi:MAG: sulfatase-like hydrolase/transferase [Candidatus Protistobacter heckmanni]|nr:sulfatase-like hydrolase/transferase [Candidatus Protistobacter heckmanni]
MHHMRDDLGLIYGTYPSTRDALEIFGFSDYNLDGDPHSSTWTGYRYDAQIASNACQWLAGKGKALNGAKPWFLAVNFVNPHDIMYFSAGRKKESTRLRRDTLSPIAEPPVGGVYDKVWDLPLPRSFYKADVTAKPWAKRSYIDFCSMLYGHLAPDDEAAWRAYQSYYFNCIHDVDSHVLTVLDTLEKLGMTGDTIVIYTADHGEIAGAQKMRQKGTHMYRENVRVPFIVRHPDVSGRVTSEAFACCLDLTPTVLGLAGVDPKAAAEKYPFLKDVDVGAAIASPKARTERDRRGILFNYGTPLYIDPEFTRKGIQADKASSELAALAVGMRTGQFQPSLQNPSLFSGILDGRYKFAHYFKPAEHHIPKDWDTLTQHNELELFDTQNDPDELNNLALAPEKNKDLLLDLSARTNALISKEVGEDCGVEFPGPAWMYNL